MCAPRHKSLDLPSGLPLIFMPVRACYADLEPEERLCDYCDNELGFQAVVKSDTVTFYETADGIAACSIECARRAVTDENGKVH